MRVGIFGAGAIGAYLGVRLSAAGVPVVMVGRQRLVDAAADLRAIDLAGNEHRAGNDLLVGTKPSVLRGVDVCLVTVKSRDTIDAGRAIGPVLGAATTVVSFQNGLRNVARLRDVVGAPVLGGMVGFNVLWEDDVTLRQATKAPLIAGDDNALRGFAAACEKAGVDLRLREDIDDVMAGKLLLNLNNGVCAVAGVSIAESIRSRTLRWCFAQLMREGLRVMKTAGLHPKGIVGLPPAAIARLLTLPNAIVLRVAKSMVAIDPRARSSTLQDLDAGKPTEIDDLSGEIVRLADNSGDEAPANALVVEAIRDLEKQPRPLPHWSARRFKAELQDVL